MRNDFAISALKSKSLLFTLLFLLPIGLVVVWRPWCNWGHISLSNMLDSHVPMARESQDSKAPRGC